MTSSTPSQERRSRPIGTVRIGTPVLVGLVFAISAPVAVAATYLDGGMADHTYANSAPIPISPVGSVDHVIVNGQNATMNIIGSPTATKVTATAHVMWASGRQEPTISQQVTGGTLALGFSCGKGDGDCGVQWDVTVPSAVALDSQTTNGDLTLTNLAGTIDSHTTNASISAVGLGGGDTTLGSSNGDIDATFAGGPANIRLTTTNASVTVKTDDTTAYYDDAVTTDGNTILNNSRDRYSKNTLYIRSTNGDVNVS